MADYWKSQPKKFCTYCKCWIADNKPSIEFHERGKNHKENVAKKISEIKQKSMDKAKEDEKKSKEFAAMEEAALKAYEEDLKRLEGAKPAPPVAHNTQQNKARDEQKWKEIEALEKHHAKKQWTKGVSPEGYPYYYNSLTGESRWEEPEDYQEKTDNSEKPGTSSVWVEGVSQEGFTYYYNAVTGESKWEKPEEFNAKQPSTDADNKAVVPKEKEAEVDPMPPPEATTEQPAEPRAEDQATENSTGTKTPKIQFRPKRAVQSDSDGETECEAKQEEAVEEKSKPKSYKREPRKPNPYGVWEAIKEEEDPYENVDLQLPYVEYDTPPVVLSDVPQEPKVKFREKAITSLGDTAEGSSAFFKKRKLENGKSRSIRQRRNDQ